jgi:formylmethanofuran dehydrogenase subunit E
MSSIYNPKYLSLNIIQTNSIIESSDVQTFNIIKQSQNQTINGIQLNVIKQPTKRKSKYTVDLVKEKGTSIHNGKFSYELVTDEHVQRWDSKIPLICKDCGYGSDGKWTPGINDDLNGRGCPNCSKRIKWTFERFVKEIIPINNKYDYRLIKPEHINGKESRIPIICLTCGYGINGEWTPTIHDHVNGKRGCPKCARNLPYTYDNFLESAIIIHGNSFDYRLVTPEHIKGWNSSVPLICNICHLGSDGKWMVSISSHIRGHGCPRCYGNEKWTLLTFVKRASSIHNNRYNYSLITEDHIENSHSKIPIICNICNKISYPTIKGHIHKKSGCAHCNSSKGELIISDYLNNNDIPFIPQYRIPSLNNRYYDFMIEWNSVKILIEFDGLQHFQYIKLFHKGSMDVFLTNKR